MVVQRGPKYRHLAYDIVYDMAAGVVQESYTAFILELLKASKVTGRSAILHAQLYSQQDLHDLWRLLRYLNGIPHLPLVYKPNSHQL
jgi:hypothetical protein